MANEATQVASNAGEDWSDEELQASVSAYLALQQAVEQGQKISKAATYRELAARFGRSSKAFEYRMRNISSVLERMGLPWLTGLLPAKNVGGSTLTKKIEALIAQAHLAEIQAAPLTANLDRERYQVTPINAPDGVMQPESVSRETQIIVRKEQVKRWVLQLAEGMCECCRQPAPFHNANGQPYLEAHHPKALGDGGSDRPENLVAVCPNCHRELHHGERKAALLERLYATIPRLERE